MTKIWIDAQCGLCKSLTRSEVPGLVKCGCCGNVIVIINNVCVEKDPCKDEKWLYARTDIGKEIITLKNRVDKLERDFNDHGHYVETTTICHNG